MEQKYDLSDLSKEEQDSFMKDFGALLDKHSLYYEPVPQFVRETMESPWEIRTQIFLQKKTLRKSEKKEPVLSDNPEVNPAIDPINPQPTA